MRLTGDQRNAPNLRGNARPICLLVSIWPRAKKVYGVKCRTLESLLHKVFSAARIDCGIPYRLGHSVKPREWFVVPLDVIDEAWERISDRSINAFR
jgi:hypothetical protein